MTAHAQVLPTVTPTALEAGEVAPALGGAAVGANTAVSGRHVVEAGTAHTAAVDAVRETLEAAERAQQTGRNHVELRLQTSGDESLRVHLRLQDGVVHAKFVTETNELRQALSREWDLLAPRLAERGMKFGETSFENRDQSGQSMAQNAFTSGQQRQQSHNQSNGRAEDFASFLSAPAASTTTASRRSSAATPATAAIPASTNDAEARGLRAWA
jgi:flagellar hook-length control protein FliK